MPKNIAVSGLPLHCKEESLFEITIDLRSEDGVEIYNADDQACHSHLSKSDNYPIIIEFVNRYIMKAVLHCSEQENT